MAHMNQTIFGEKVQLDSNLFSQSHRHITTMKMGYLYPTLVKEILPGDQINIQSSKLARFFPMIAPVMGNVKITEHYFFVPNRIVWSQWEDFITGKSTDLTVPKVLYDPISKDSGFNYEQMVGVYMGLPLNANLIAGQSVYVDAMPIAGYLKIYDQYYRNELTQTEKYEDLVSGPQTLTYQYLKEPLRKNWTRDYVLGATPTPQAGAAVLLPLTTTDDIDVYMRSTAAAGGNAGKFKLAATDAVAVGDQYIRNNEAGTGGVAYETATNNDVKYDPNDTLGVNINSSAVTIETLRTALTLQQFLERDMSGGKKYIESILTHFGVRVHDYRAQVPEYLGGNVQWMNFTEVLSKSETSVDADFLPIGSMAGHGYSAAAGDNVYYTSQEHGYLFSIVSFEPELIYSNTGLAKSWTRTQRTDYAFPTFAHLGAQSVLKDEIFFDSAEEGAIFGYRPMYDEYKQTRSRISGEIGNTLDFWSLYIKWTDGNTNLNAQTQEINERLYDLDRIFSVDTSGPSSTIEDYILVDIHFDMAIRSKLPKFNVPNLNGSGNA